MELLVADTYSEVVYFSFKNMDLIPTLIIIIKNRYLEVDTMKLNARVFIEADTWRYPSPHPLIP